MPRPRNLTPRQRLESRVARFGDLLPPELLVRMSGKPPIHIDGQTLDPGTQLWLSISERLDETPFEELPLPEARHQTVTQSQVVGGRPIAVAGVDELMVDGGAGPLRARHYRCPDPGAPHPLLVFLHGGGFVLGDLDSHDAICRLLCRAVGADILSVDYRLAPEHPFPEPVEDATAAVRWALANAATLGADPERVAVAGDSAGGNLATVACWQLVRAGEPAPMLQVLFYPGTDDREFVSKKLFGEGFFLTRKQMDWFATTYLVDPANRDDDRFSIGRADDLTDMPPAIIVTGGFDPLRDEGENYVRVLREAGNDVVHRRFPGLIHGFANAIGVSRASRDAVVETAGMARAMLTPAQVREPVEV
ncbi:MAG: alpha/beta hydrolase [Solirubrobacterales bacterium]